MRWFPLASVGIFEYIWLFGVSSWISGLIFKLADNPGYFDLTFLVIFEHPHLECGADTECADTGVLAL